MAILGVCAIMACHARRGVTMHSARVAACQCVPMHPCNYTTFILLDTLKNTSAQAGKIQLQGLVDAHDMLKP